MIQKRLPEHNDQPKTINQNLGLRLMSPEQRERNLCASSTASLASTADLVARKVDATSAIPILFHSTNDPVAIGPVTSFARPGGNLNRRQPDVRRTDTQTQSKVYPAELSGLGESLVKPTS